MLLKIKKFFLKLIPTKRRLIQLYAALLYNANIKGFITGDIFEGLSKSACLPGLNCYSCPGAIGACPLGSLQNALAESKTKVPTYVIGIILLYSIILGRTICGFLCPVGLLQELLYKIKSPKLKKNKVTRILSYFKYVLLALLVIIVPLIYALQSKNVPLPAFCKYICPAGTFEGAIFLLSNPNNEGFFQMLGYLFTWKFILLIVFIVASVFIYRFFCRFFCPLGALYGLFNKISILGVKVDKSKCNHCNACVNHCKMDVLEVGDHECIQCGECKKVCHIKAIDWKKIRKEIKEEELKENSDSVSTNNEKVKVNKEKRNNIILITVLGVILIVVLAVVNFKKNVFEVNDVLENVNFALINEEKFDFSDNENATLLYFTDKIDNEYIETLKKYSSDSLNIILILSNSENEYINENELIELQKYGIFVTVDENNKLIKKFNKQVIYPFTVFTDKNDKILIKENKLITDEDYISIVSPVMLGKTVGKEVGDICINKTINLIGSDETFSVLNNRGKITVINFWYDGCTPCVLELPHFNKIQNKYKDDVTIIAIHDGSIYQSKPDDIVEFINNNFDGFSILFGYDDTVNPYYKQLVDSQSWPYTVIVDEEGVISFVSVFPLSEEELENEIIKLLD